jgi:uncharacterized protein involved in exopolysaccharide biosynthesis
MAEPATEVGLGDIGRAVARRWHYILIPTLLAFIGSLLFVTLVTPRYTGEAKLLLQTSDSFYTRPGQERATEQLQFDEQAVASQVQVVLSRDLAREVIKKLGLVGNPEFDPGARGIGLVQRLGLMLGLSKDPSARPAEDRVLERYYENLVVYPVGKSRIVSIEFRSRDPEIAARAANLIAETYLAFQEDAKMGLARSASTWLGSNIDTLRQRVAEAEAKVEEFRARTGLLSGTGTTTLSAQQLSELSGQLAQARTAQADAQSKARLIRELIRDGRAFEIPDVANNELVRRLIEQRVTLRAQLALELRTLLPQHPRIKELNAQLNDLEGQIRGAGERTARTLENDSKLAADRVAGLEAALESQKKIVGQANESEVQLRALEREARIQREQLESYLGRYREATARDSANAIPPDARIVSRAVEPSIASFPKKTPIVILTTLAAFVLSTGLVVARELLGGAPPSRSVPARSGAAARLTASPPQAERGRDLVAAGEPAPPEPDPRYDFAQLIERLRRSGAEGRGRRVLVTGIERGSEEREVARGLALTLSRSASAILVEADPDDLAETSDEPGLTDLVAGEASFSDVIRREPGTKLDRVAMGTLRNDALTSGPDGVDVVLEALEKTYDWVVCVLVGGGDGRLLGLLAPRFDAVVIASNLEPANKDLVRAYEAARDAGATDVIVAREQGDADLGKAA